MKVSEVMTPNPVTARQSDTLGDVVRMLTEHKISGVPIVSRNKLVGVVTQTDIIKSIDVYDRVNKNNISFDMIIGLLESSDEKVKASLKKMMSAKVRSLKQKQVVTVESEDDLFKSATLINMHGIDRLPVVRGGKLVGIISKTDLILALSRAD